MLRSMLGAHELNRDDMGCSWGFRIFFFLIGVQFRCGSRLRSVQQKLECDEYD